MAAQSNLYLPTHAHCACMRAKSAAKKLDVGLRSFSTGGNDIGQEIVVLILTESIQMANTKRGTSEASQLI
jgi:hypothetical protein